MNQNDRVPSRQALNVERSLGQSLGVRTWRNLLSAQLYGDVYEVVWKPTIGEKLQADQELGNEADKFADRQRDLCYTKCND